MLFIYCTLLSVESPGALTSMNLLIFPIPPHFTTREFFSIAKEKLFDDGVFVANVVGDLSRCGSG